MIQAVAQSSAKVFDHHLLLKRAMPMLSGKLARKLACKITVMKEKMFPIDSAATLAIYLNTPHKQSIS